MRNSVHFWKIEAAGNDFVLIDHRDLFFKEHLSELANFLCDRHFGVGADGTIFIQELDKYDFEMLYYNADGSGPVMCGNGGRAALLFVNESGICTQKRYKFHAADGIHVGIVENGKVSLTIQQPENFHKINLESEEAYLVDTGVPHLVKVQKNLISTDIYSESPELRKKFDTNIDYIEKVSHGNWAIRTYERGVEDETLSCGTGAAASAFIISEVFNEKMPVTLKSRGGDLQIEKISDKFWLNGPTRKVFEGTIKLKNLTKEV